MEVDGPFHFRRHDKKRDKHLRDQQGIETLRLNVAKKYWRQDMIKEAVMSFINAYAYTTEERKVLFK